MLGKRLRFFVVDWSSERIGPRYILPAAVSPKLVGMIAKSVEFANTLLGVKMGHQGEGLVAAEVLDVAATDTALDSSRLSSIFPAVWNSGCYRVVGYYRIQSLGRRGPEGSKGTEHPEALHHCRRL